MATIAAILGRILLGALFVFAGFGKILDPSATASFMEAQSPFPGSWAMGVGIFEIVAGLVLASGFMTRLAAAVLIGFTVLATLFFHEQITDPAQQVLALKNLAIVGGLLMVFAYGQMSGTFGKWRERDKRHDAEVRAAHAEGRVEGSTTTVVTDPTPAAPTRPLDRDGDGHPG